MDSKLLISTAKYILRQIKVGDIFGIGTQEEYVDEKTLPIVNQWVKEVYDLGAKSAYPLGRELCDLWFLNGNRVNSERIERAIEILGQL